MSAGPQADQRHPDGRLRRARRAVLVVFFVHGALFANWVPLIPTVQQNLGLSAGTLGLALLGSAVGSLIAMPVAGSLIARAGSRRVVTIAGIAYCATLLLPVVAPTLLTLFFALVVFGACQGSTDVAMNAQGSTVETRYGRPLMSSFHGFWSLGGLTGAGISGALAAAGIAPVPHVLGATIILGALLLAATRSFLPRAEDASAHGPAFARLTPPLIWLGIVGFGALMAEGSIGDWSALYLRRILGASPGLAAAGYATFTLTMTIGRLTGDRLTAYLGPVRLVRLGGALLAVGLGGALLLDHIAATLAGFALIGFALANIVPILFSAAGRTPHLAPGPAIAAVSTASFVGFLVGPPVIGVTADHVTLRGGLAIVAGLGILIAILAPAVGRAAAGSQTVDPESTALNELA
ncbi:MAG TPA: MFS transporter [Chloroflexota bacterium]|nr:MFS transporter [Chloroflexota bacterium]